MKHPGSYLPRRIHVLPALIVLTASVGMAKAAEIRLFLPPNIISPGPVEAYRPVFPVHTLERRLEQFVGRHCNPAELRETLSRPYRFLGYAPDIRVECGDGEVEITVRESSHRIDLITFDREALAGIGVTASGEVEDPFRSLYAVPGDAPREVLRGLLQTRVGDLYNHRRYRNDSDALARFGYAIAFIAGAPEADGGYPRGAYLIQSAHPRAAPGAPSTRDRNYLGGTASYAPRSGGSTGLIYRRNGVFGRMDSLVIAPDYSAALGGEIAYRAPFLADRAAPRRLYEFETSWSSRYQRDRLFEGVEVDERRSIAAVAIGIRPLGMPAPHEFHWRFSLRHERVDLEEVVAGVDKESLTLFRFGWTHIVRHNFRRPSFTFRALPAIDVSFDGAGGSLEFVRPSLDATLHLRFPSGFDFRFHVVGGSIDRTVPDYELWSLGGVDTVRGFREDTLLGRHRAALQAEMWFPLLRTLDERPMTAGEFPDTLGATPLESRAARLFRGAIFVDGGVLSGAPDDSTGSLVGAGIGLRFIMPRQPLVIRLDYGWGLGGRGGDSYPYLSLGYRF